MAKEKSKYYKHPRYGHVYGVRILTPFGRAAWPSLVTPKDPPPPQEGQAPGNPRYELTILLKKKDKEVTKFISQISDMAQEMLVLFNKGRSAKLAIDSVLKDGDEFDLEKYPYYKDNYILVARNVKKVNVVDGKKREIEHSMIEGGNTVCVLVTPLITAHGLSFKLEIVQYIRDDGTKFAGAFAAPDTYLSVIETDEEEDGLQTDTEDAETETDEEEEQEEEEEEEEIAAKNGKPKKRGRPTKSKGKQMAVEIL